MKQQEVFLNAKWLGAPDQVHTRHPGYLFPILQRKFNVQTVKKATLRVVGLGYFHAAINGKEVSKDRFLPLYTDYCARKDYPQGEILHGHRIYVPEFDVTALLQPGENLLTVHFGGGFYTNAADRYSRGLADARAIYRLTLETEQGTEELLSTAGDEILPSAITDYHITVSPEQYGTWENHDYTLAQAAPVSARELEDLETEYLFSDCPADRVTETLKPQLLGKDQNGSFYDAGRNVTALPVLRLTAPRGETVQIRFAEERKADGSPDWNFGHNQKMCIVSDGAGRIVRPLFTWFSFRYFQITGEAEPVGAEVIRSNVRISSGFASNLETLNWLYKAYLNTQLNNMHSGIPSDCPHIERRGYTGDGQLTCHAVMDTMDAKSFYRKWIGDISDCQDTVTGHVQYTAPYYCCGGGPGGWGCAIAEVPYQFYKHYGDAEPAKAMYPQMKQYLDYLDAHSENDLVISDQPGSWCLGDWCPPIQVILPAPFVNNYFYIRTAMRMEEIACLAGAEAEIPQLEERIRIRKQAIMHAYFNTWDGNFIGCMQGANAFALDIGLGDERTYQNLVRYYRQLGRYDTGIFGTDLVTKILFERGDGELAVQLMNAQENTSFAGMRRAGATTLWENWPDSVWDRSRNHPMFGAVTAYLFDYLLGITQEENSAGYEKLVISPVLVKNLSKVTGYREIPSGRVSVTYERKVNRIDFVILLPDRQKAVLRVQEKEYPLTPGENRITLE